MNKKNKLPLKDRLIDNFFAIIFVILLPLWIVLALLFGIWYLIYSLWLGFLVKLKWYPEGKNLLFVYSNSPNWKEYIENNILTKLSGKAVIVNWSERSKWNWGNKPLELKIFRHWTGVNRYFLKGKKKWDGEEFNPAAITFIPWWKPKILRFWKAFKDHKHGKEKRVKDLENQLFKILNLKE